MTVTTDQLKTEQTTRANADDREKAARIAADTALGARIDAAVARIAALEDDVATLRKYALPITYGGARSGTSAGGGSGSGGGGGTGGSGLTISNIVVSAVTQTSFVVTWDLSDYGQGWVEYGPTTAYGADTTHETSYTYRSHRQTVSGLTAGTTYHFRIHANGPSASPVETTSADQTQTTTASSTTAIYGAKVTGNTLYNVPLNSTILKGFIGFQAEQNSAPDQLIWYLEGADAGGGYGGGTGGTYRIGIWSDDGSAEHLPSALLGSWTTFGAAGNTAGGKVSALTGTPTLTVGTYYHIYFENTDGSPASNFFSFNCWYDWRGTVEVPTGLGTAPYVSLNPGYTTAQAHVGFWDGGWGSKWVRRDGFTPIYDLRYANGSHQGMCYGEAYLSAFQSFGGITSSQYLRERFTVSGGAFTTVGAGLRVGKLGSTTADLRVSLRSTGGSEIDYFLVPASSITTVTGAPNGADSPQGGGGEETYVTGTWVGGSHSLTNGTEYAVWVMSTGGSYYMNPQRSLGKGGYGYDASTSAFAGLGNAEYSTNSGGSWSAYGSSNADLSLHLV